MADVDPDLDPREALDEQHEIDAEMRDSRADLLTDEQRRNERAQRERATFLDARERYADERDAQLDQRESRLDQRESGVDLRESALGTRQDVLDERDKVADQREINEAQRP